MSSSGESESAVLAREQEKAALAKAKADLEAEHEAMRAELAAIEEEERLEAERLQKEAQQAKSSSKGPSTTPTPVSGTKPQETTTKTPKASRNKGVDGERKGGSAVEELATENSAEGDAKGDKKDKKDKRKEKQNVNGEATGEIAPKEKRKGDKEKSGAGAAESAGSEESGVVSPKGERKEKRDKKPKGTVENAGEASSSLETTAAEGSHEAKDRKDKHGKRHPAASTTSVPDSSNGTKKPKDKTAKRDRATTTAIPSSSDSEPAVTPSGKKDVRDKIQKADSSDKLEKPDKQEKEKKPKRDRPAASVNSSSAPEASSSDKPPAKSKTVLANSDNKVPMASPSSEDLTAKTAPRQLARVESSLKIPVLDLTNRRIAELPGDIGNCTYLTKLYLARNLLTDVAALSSLSELSVLTLSNNSLTSFPVGLSSTKSKLKDLLIADNRIASIPASITSLKFPVLTKLDLMGNKFSEMPPAIFTIHTLTYLNMSWNGLTEVPKAISSLTNLTSLLLHHNQLKKISSAICQLAKLLTLELNENALTSIPESIAELCSLTSLDVSFNALREWPAAFSTDTQLPSLSKIDLSHNQITGAVPDDRFPEEATMFPAIEEFYLNHNQITSLPTNFWRNIATVSVLDLRNNQLTELSTEIESFYSLGTLEIGSNRLTALPGQIGQLANLQVLSFYSNQITAIPDLSALEYLQYLNMGHNQVSEVALDGLVSLEELFMSGNPLKQLPENIAECCPNLKLLFAADILLKKVPTGLNQMTLLEQIDFSNNRISEIPPSLGDLESLRSISFAHCKLETSKEREVLKTPGKGPWDCIEFWQNFGQLLLVDLSHNKLKYIPKGLETKLGAECEVILIGNPMVTTEDSLRGQLLAPQLGKRYQVGWAEMLGRRPTMEDHFLWQGALDGNTQVDLFAVFDGHAARDAARFCAEYLPDVLKEQLAKAHGASGSEKEKDKTPKLTKSDTLFTNVFNLVNTALEKHLATVRDSSVKHCGTTAVVVLIAGDTMQIANVGDSRAVLSTGERCTVDHKPRAETDRIRSQPGGFVTGDGSGRINEVLAVSRSLGDFYMHPWVSCQPHVFTKTLTKEDRYIVLACDGIWDEIADSDAIAIVDPLVNEGELFKAASKLRDIAYCAGSDDNISVMIIKLNSK